MSISLRNVISILCPDHKFENNTSTQSENIVPYHTSKYTETSQYSITVHDPDLLPIMLLVRVLILPIFTLLYGF